MKKCEMSVTMDNRARDLLALAYYRGVADAQYRDVEISDPDKCPTGEDASWFACRRIFSLGDQVRSITGGDGCLSFTDEG